MIIGNPLKIKTFYSLFAVLILTIACSDPHKNEATLWNNRQCKLIRFSANNEYLVIAATKKNDSSSYNPILTKLFIFKNINKSYSNNLGWSIVGDTSVFSTSEFESLYVIRSNSVALALVQTNSGGAHAMNEMHLYKIDTNGKLEYRRESYEEYGSEPDGTEHFAVTVINDSTMTMIRDQGTYKYSIVRNEINRTFISNIEKAENKGAVEAKYILSNDKISAYGASTFHLRVGQAIIFDGADAKTNKAPIEGIFTDAWNNGFLSVCEADRLRDFTYTFTKPGEFHFIVAYQTVSSTREEEVEPTFTVIVSPR